MARHIHVQRVSIAQHVRRAVCACCLVAGAAVLPAAVHPADAAMRLTGARGMTLDSFGRQVSFAALAADDEGRLAASLAGDGQTTDVGERLVVPGFVLADVEAAGIFAQAQGGVAMVLAAHVAQGWTTVHVSGIGSAQWQALADLPSRRSLPRVVAALDGDTASTAALLRAGPVVVDEHLALTGVRYRLDDAAGATLRYPASRLKNLIVRAIMWKWQLVLRAETGAAVDQAIEAFAETLPVLGTATRPMLVAATPLLPEQADRLSALGVALVVDAAQLPHLQAIVARGTPVAVMTDAPLALLGDPPAAGLLRAPTSDPAQALRLQGRAGVLVPGAAADLLVVDAAGPQPWISGQPVVLPAPSAQP